MKARRAEKVVLSASTAGPAAAPPTAATPLPTGTRRKTASRAARSSAASARASRWRSKSDILQAVAATGRFETFGRVIQGAGLAGMLAEEGPFTIFAPTDKAFAKLPGAELDSLFGDKPRLVRVLSYHIVPERVRAPRIGSPRSATTAQGGELTITAEDGGGYSVGEARIVKTNIRASNGVIHAIDTVLMPR